MKDHTHTHRNIYAVIPHLTLICFSAHINPLVLMCCALPVSQEDVHGHGNISHSHWFYPVAEVIIVKIYHMSEMSAVLCVELTTSSA